MSQATVCDNCGAVLPKSDPDGESGGWLQIGTAFAHYDACTRSCAQQILEDPDFIEALDAQLEAVTEVARTIREAQEGDDE